MKTNKKGISLIVLVITIVVMIIIAAAILLYLDDDKIVSRAKTAVNASNMSAAKEVMVVAKTEWNTKKEQLIKEEYYSFEMYAEHKLKEAGFDIGTEVGQVDVSETGLLRVYVEPTIPQGYVASNIETEDEVAEGLVIYEGDASVVDDEDAATTRNQYVWVPVPNITEFVRKDWGKGVTGNAFTNNLKSYDLNIADEAAEYTAMKESVAKYGGFYIARYEAGNENDVVVSKKEATVWSNIVINDAKSKASEVTPSKAKVVSHLIYGEEWDAALNFMSKTDPEYPTNSADKGYYMYDSTWEQENPTIIQKAGSKDTYAVNNIYDMAGNVSEITFERYGTVANIHRGGSCENDDNGSTYPAAYRGQLRKNGSVEYKGFRVALYLK